MVAPKNQLTEIDEQMVPMRDEKKWYSGAFGKLIAERQNSRNVLHGSFDPRDELNQKIQATIAAERQECFRSDCARRTEGGKQPKSLLPAGCFSL